MLNIIRIFFLIVSLLFSSSLYGHIPSEGESNDKDNEIKKQVEKIENYIHNKNFKSSLRLLKKIVKREDLDGFRADIYNLLGFTYRNLSKPDLEKSYVSYMMALEIDPDHIGALEYLGELYLMRNEKDKAIDMLERLEKIAGVDAEEYLELLEAINNY